MSDLISRQAAIDALERAKTAMSEDGEIFCAKNKCTDEYSTFANH